MTTMNEGGRLPKETAEGAAHAETSVPPTADSWAAHHGSPCSCGCEPVRGERLAEILAYTRSQIAKAPETTTTARARARRTQRLARLEEGL